ncbi:MAG TPA: hypothetical protein PKB06_00005, partial [Actinotalea sp.]|nr:hypothetical protein [Actinotalea sp.]
YLVVVVLVLVAEAVHGRTPHLPEEYAAAAADQAVAGLVGGFTPRARAHARDLLARAGQANGAAEVEALLRAIDDDPREAPNPIGAVSGWMVRGTRRLVGARAVPALTVAVLVASIVTTVVRGLLAWQDADHAWWMAAGMVVGAAVSLALAGWGLAVVRRDRHRAYLRFRRAVLVSLLVTQWFVFLAEQFSAVGGLVVDLVVLALVEAELDQLDESELAPRRARGRGAQRVA